MGWRRALIVSIVGIAVVVAYYGWHAWYKEYLSREHRRQSPAAHGDIGPFNSALQRYQVDVTAKRIPTTVNQEITDTAATGWARYRTPISRDPWRSNRPDTGDATDSRMMPNPTHELPKTETIRYQLGCILSTLP